MPVDVSADALERRDARRSSPTTPASTCTASSPTSSATSSLLPTERPRGWSPSSAARSATSSPAQRARRSSPRSARRCEPGDALLLGTDLVKDPDRLVRAYDDAAGVTAEFNLNVLHVINRELGADFDVDAFEHVAVWDAEQEWIEMRLRSLRRPDGRRTRPRR